MKVIVAGGRDFDDRERLSDVMCELGYLFDDDIEVVSGGAPGADTLGKEWAENLDIPVRVFPAYWDLYHEAAGPLRNKEMAFYADELVAFWDGESRGTRSMIHEAKSRGLKVHVYRYEEGAK